MHDSYHRDREADGDHDNVVQHHEELATQVAGQRRAHVLGYGRGLLVPFHLQLVPVAHEHCVDVIHEVGNGKHDVGASQPMPVLTKERQKREMSDIECRKEFSHFAFLYQSEHVNNMAVRARKPVQFFSLKILLFLSAVPTNLKGASLT